MKIHRWLRGQVRIGHGRVCALVLTLGLGLALAAREGEAEPLTPAEVLLSARGGCWRYWDRGIEPGPGWNEPGYDDTEWRVGFSEFGYGDGDEATQVGFGASDADKHITTWFRQVLPMTETDGLTDLVLKIKRDDGVVVYLNGVEVFRDNLPPGDIGAGTLALAPASDDGEGYLVTNLSPALLWAGQNVLAAEVHQAAVDSPDLSFDAALIARFASAPPALQIERAGAAITVSWPAGHPSGVMESSPALGVGAAWSAVPGIPSEAGGRMQLDLPVPAGAGFFRLAGAELARCPPPLVLTQALVVRANIGSDVTLTVPVLGTGPFGFQWRVNEIHLEGATNQSLSFTNVQRSEGGAYQAVIVNECGCTISCPINLVVGGEDFPLADDFGLRLSTNSAAGMINFEHLGATLQAGEPDLPFERDGHSVWLTWVAPAAGLAEFDTDGSGRSTALAVYEGTTLAGLGLSAVAGNDRPHLSSRVRFNAVSGQAYAISVDGSGAGTMLALNWQLTAPSPVGPQIIVPPLSQSVLGGSPVLFSVLATNVTLYQWRSNGVPIVDATNATYLIATATPAEVASYDVVVGNLVSTAISAAGSLRVTTVIDPDSGITYLPLADFRYAASCKVGSKTTNYSKALGFCFYAPATPGVLSSCGTSLYSGGWNGIRINGSSFTQLEIDTVLDANSALNTAVYYFPITGSTALCPNSCADSNAGTICPRLAQAGVRMCPGNTLVRVVVMFTAGQPLCAALPPAGAASSSVAFQWNYR